MAPHLTHVGVHDHGFNNVSTYGNLWRLIERRPHRRRRRGSGDFYELALKASGAVQAARWAKTRDGTGYIYSFNGPQSLFVDTIRSCRSLALAHQLGHALMGERDERISLLRAARRARERTRPATTSGTAKAATRTTSPAARPTKSSSTRTTATTAAPRRSKAIRRSAPGPAAWPGRCSASPKSSNGWRRAATTSWRRSAAATAIEATFLKAARATCDFYIAQHAHVRHSLLGHRRARASRKLGDYLDRPADPFNDYEPVDSSAAAIACAGPAAAGPLPRPRTRRDEGGRPLRRSRPDDRSTRCSTSRTCRPTSKHEGLILHSVYHRPNGWDYVPPGRKVPCGESSMWGDYHAREAALYVAATGRERAVLHVLRPD